MSFVKLPILRHGLMIRHSDILSDRKVEERIARVRALMSARKVEGLLVYSDPIRNGPVCYLTNYPCFGLGRRATAVLGLTEGPFLYTAEPSRNLPRVRLFTTCDLEKTRLFLSSACKRAKEISGEGCLGLVGIDSLPSGLVKETVELKDLEIKDLTSDFSLLMAAKDESSIQATLKACALAQRGLSLLGREAAPGRDLWQLAAHVDYRLRLEGCEDANILLAAGGESPMRPGYPDHTQLSPGDTLVAYVGVQYARHWGVAGSAFAVQGDGDALGLKMAMLQKTKERVAPAVKAGMTLKETKTVMEDAAAREGAALAEDVPAVNGLGFDLLEYPVQDGDVLKSDMILQVSLTADFNGSGTAMTVDMLRVSDKGSAWISPGDFT